MEFESKIAEFIRGHELIIERDKVLAAVSGGVDSTVMLQVLSKLSMEMGFTVGATHFNHRLRGDESERDAVFTEAICRELGVEFHLGEWKEKPGRGSLQTAARQARFAFFHRVMAEQGFDRLALGQHADDNVETVLMGVMKGYGISGMKGIEAISGKRIHPLLCVRRAEIEQYAREKGLKWVEDSSNLSDKYLRNRVRNRVLPILQKEFPDLKENILRLSRNAQDFLAVVNAIVDIKLKDAVIREGKARIILDIDKIFPYFNMLNNFVFRRILTDLDSDIYVSRGGLDQIERLLYARTGSYTETAGIRIFMNRNNLVFAKSTDTIDCISVSEEGEYIFNDYVINVKQCGIAGVEINSDACTEYIDAGRVSGGLIIRKWKAGDWFIPLGLGKKVKLSDFFVDRHVGRHQKDRVPILCDGEKIIWVCGMRLDDRARITRETEKAIKFNCRRLDFISL